MIFITLLKFRKKASDVVAVGKEILQNLPPNVKIVAMYWTLGRYDAIWVYEAENEKDAIKLFIKAGDVVSTETLVAIPREDAMKLL